MYTHNYKLTTKWTGNKGEGTSGYRLYERSHTISIENKPDIFASADPAFRGDAAKYNPEDMLLAALSGCHMMSYLHVCVEAGVIVTDYIDYATGTMVHVADGSGRFTEVVLNPIVTVADESMVEKANELHAKANKLCFIANSCNFPIHHNAVCNVEKES